MPSAEVQASGYDSGPRLPMNVGSQVWRPNGGSPDVGFGHSSAMSVWQPQYLPPPQQSQLHSMATPATSTGGRKQPLGRDVCRTCRQTGHWSRECPNRRQNIRTTEGLDRQQNADQAQVGGFVHVGDTIFRLYRIFWVIRCRISQIHHFPRWWTLSGVVLSSV